MNKHTGDVEKIFSPAVLAKRMEQNPFEKLTNIVYQMLEDAIINRALAPGMKLNMVQIAQSLGISRTPVKEAVELLVNEGLVVMPPSGSGYYVFDITSVYMDDLLDARRAIEGAAAYLCTQRNYRVDIPKLYALSEEFSAAYEKRDFTEFARSDRAFHWEIVNTCGNRFLMNAYVDMTKVLRYYWARTRDYLERLGSAAFNDFDVIAHQHKTICRTIELGVPDIAENAMRKHIETIHTAFYAISPP